jgi:hypothetical protein
MLIFEGVSLDDAKVVYFQAEYNEKFDPVYGSYLRLVQLNVVTWYKMNHSHDWIKMKQDSANYVESLYQQSKKETS